jgi:hypothetical protein
VLNGCHDDESESIRRFVQQIEFRVLREINVAHSRSLSLERIVATEPCAGNNTQFSGLSQMQSCDATPHDEICVIEAAWLLKELRAVAALPVLYRLWLRSCWFAIRGFYIWGIKDDPQNHTK